MHVLSACLDFLFPPRRTERVARSAALATLAPSLSPMTVRIGGTDIVALMPYRDPTVRALIREAKYYGHARASRMLAAVLEDYLHEYLTDLIALEKRPVTLVPIPLSRERKRERGYNQVEHVCRQVALPMETTILRRVRDTKAQTTLGRRERQENLQGAFAADACDPDRLYVLVDDVLTTGATLTDAVRALTEAGAMRVAALALAH